MCCARAVDEVHGIEAHPDKAACFAVNPSLRPCSLQAVVPGPRPFPLSLDRTMAQVHSGRAC